jgi:hypothetical protein
MNIPKNPFQITTPENLTPKDTVDLFVDVFTDFPQIIDPGHVFLMGPRGVGKSMMFRYLQSDCQCIVGNNGSHDFSELKFLGMYIPIKNVSYIKTELKRLDDRHASEIFNEHLMVSDMCIKVFDSLIKNECALTNVDSKSISDYYNNIFMPLLYPYESNEDSIHANCSVKECIDSIIKVMNRAYKSATDYAKRLSFTESLPVYSGPLFDYQDFLAPLLAGLSSVNGFPSGPIYLLIDDAHFLSEIQTRILNSWIATRTSGKISIKVSSQYNYKNYYTVTGATIDSPHDYTEVDMTTVYTSQSGKSNYRDRIKSIVERRLNLAKCNTTAEDFFPCDISQENEIQRIADTYRDAYDRGEQRGYRKSDDANRYARPDFIKKLSGTSKNSMTYSYSGFDQLVHLSSGIVRYFLEHAHKMYSKAIADTKKSFLSSIEPRIQNEISRKEAESFLFNELDKFTTEGDDNATPKEDIDRLANLIQGLGGLFRQVLLSERSERRVFSIAISDNVSEEVERILKIGVNLGYFHRSTIGRKDSKSGGRTRLYVMNRRLAPIWNLDPTGFAGYLFVKNSILEEGIRTPFSMLRRVSRNDFSTDDSIEYKQLKLFGDDMPNSIEVIDKEDELNG